jgi:hypothetical protein
MTPEPVITTSETSSAMPRRSLFASFGKGIAASLVLLLALGLGASVYGAYHFGWNNGLVRTASKALGLAAARVDGAEVRMSDYLSVLAFARGLGAEEGEQVRRNVLNELERGAVVERMAAEAGVLPSAEDVNTACAAALLDVPAETAQLIDDAGVDTCRVFVRPQVVEGRLAEKRASELLEKLKAPGADFAALAKEYGEDSTAETGGDLGTFGRDEMVAEFEAAAFALAPGELSGLVRTEFGYHVIKLEGQEKAKDGTVEKVHARHILVGTPAQFVTEAFTAAKIEEYVKG